MPPARILLVDDEPNLRKVLGALLTQAGFDVVAAEHGRDALARVQAFPPGTFDAVISDLRMPELDGLGLLRELSTLDPDLPVVILTAHGTVDTAVEAVKRGAFDFIEKPFERDHIVHVLGRAVAARARRGAGTRAAPPSSGSPTDPCAQVGLIGQNAAITNVRTLVLQAAASPSSALIVGEIGTGKELVARALHAGSDRREAPFLRINCAAIPADQWQAELFGTTHDASRHPGRLELAQGGTLYLEEVDHLSKDAQIHLLRVLQDQSFVPTGQTQATRLTVRVLASTTEDLQHHETFREDLFYALNVIAIPLPPLRERLDDLPRLAAHFIERSNERLGKRIEGLTTAALKQLESYRWPGNIRELAAFIERMVLFATRPTLDVDDLPEPLNDAVEAGDTPHEGYLRLPLHQLGHDLKEAVRTGSRLVEEALIREALAQTGSNVTHAARMLGISRRGLQSKMKELGLRE